MNAALLEQFEAALRERNPRLAQKLHPGIPKDRISRILTRADVHGAVQPIIALFAWKNGTEIHDFELSREQASPFPKSVYLFMELEMMTAHFSNFKDCLRYHPEYAKIVGRYFPLFWDGSNSWLAIKLDAPDPGQIVLIHSELEQIVFRAYDSFTAFLRDAIRANQQNDGLTCFEKLDPMV
jgi:hypothetical protein